MTSSTKPSSRSVIGREWIMEAGADQGPPGHAAASAALRILLGLLWLYNVSWKRPPDFGRDSGHGLYGFTTDAVTHPVFAPYSWIVEHVVLPNFTVFGWLVLTVETALAVMLLTGAFVRVAALIGIGQSLAIALSVTQTPGEWPWSYWLMIGAHVAILFSSAGAVLAVDALRARGGGQTRRFRLSLVWGVVATAAGLLALVLSLGEPALSATGTTLGGSGLSISLGSYNLVGALVLLLSGVALLTPVVMRDSRVTLVAAGLGLAAAISLFVQNAFTDPWLGGSNTSAAFFLCVAVVGAATWSTGRQRTS